MTTDNSATLIYIIFINEPCNFDSGLLISDISDHFPIFFTRKNFFCVNLSLNANKIHCRFMKRNSLSALNEMLALTNLNDIASNVNINEATEHFFIEFKNYLISLIMHLNQAVPFDLKLYLIKIQLNHGVQGRFAQISRKRKTILHLLDKIKCPLNSMLDLEILSQIKLGKQK